MTADINLLDLGLDWKLAVQRVAKDVRDDFWTDPLAFTDLLSSGESASARLEPLLKSYRPRPGVSYCIPKSNFTIRDSIHISALDRIVYQALIDPIVLVIDSMLSANVFSHRLRTPPTKWMFHSGVSQWKKFTDTVKMQLRARPGSWLVVTDLSRYFETISFRCLRRQLEQVPGEKLTSELKRCVDVLMACLTAWSPYDGYGLVQNVDASSFLGNVLLDGIDKLMEKEGYAMIRYMDDIRIVVPSEADARKALVSLVCHLRDIGLGLNSEKTQVLSPGSERIKDYLKDDDPDIGAIEQAIGTKDRATIQRIVDLLFGKAFNLLENERVGERVFRFCLNRIASLRAYRNLELPEGSSLTDRVLRLLVQRPHETDTFCRYLEVAPLSSEQLAEIERLLTGEPLCVYAWQNFHLWRLASQRHIRSTTLTRRAHDIIVGNPYSPDTGAAALYLGSCGDYADRQKLKKMLYLPASPLVKRCLQISIQELNKSERNTAYRDLADGDREVAILTEHLQGLHEPIYVDNPPEVSIEDLPDAMPSVYA
jgi:Reverse transcriptase (RNA-dependent DNA polymerase)